MHQDLAVFSGLHSTVVQLLCDITCSSESRKKSQFSPTPDINFVYNKNKFIKYFKVNIKADKIISDNFNFASSIFPYT